MNPTSKLLFAALTLFFALGLACDDAEEAIDDFNSAGVCKDYCAKKFACADQSPTSEESSACVSSCRDSIENNCGNEHQAQANDTIGNCVDKGCAEFTACMVFDAAPECFGFVSK